MATADEVRTPEESARSQANVIVFDALQEIEHLTTRLRRYRSDVDALSGCADLATVLGTAADRLDTARRELQQGALFSNGQTRLF